VSIKSKSHEILSDSSVKSPWFERNSTRGGGVAFSYCSGSALAAFDLAGRAFDLAGLALDVLR
jgi:hypothetical protein